MNKDELNEVAKILNKPAPDQIKTFPIGGKGRKQCKECRAFVGVRTQVCVCGNEFKRRTYRGKKVHEITEIDPGFKRALLFSSALGFPAKGSVVYATGDYPNIKYNGDIGQWCSDMIGMYYSRDNRILSVDALKYILRYQLGAFSKETRKVLNELDAFVAESIGAANEADNLF